MVFMSLVLVLMGHNYLHPNNHAKQISTVVLKFSSALQFSVCICSPEPRNVVAFLKEALLLLTLCMSMSIFTVITSGSSFRCFRAPTLWFILPYSIHFSELMPIFFYKKRDT